MDDLLQHSELCIICKEEYTNIYAEASPGQTIYVCKTCLESARQNFIWICVRCGSVFIRPKALVLKRLKEPALIQAYRQCENLQMIQGIDQCVECGPESFKEQLVAARCERNHGHC